jgi:glyoxylase-like metal-dependent hydrolase (beta-lactamase superfamily II)
VHQIQLTNNAFEGRNSVYLFGASGDGPTILVDTGVATPAVREELTTKLAARGVAFADVDVVLVTHWHHDHAGLAGAIQAAGDATVYVHERDAPIVEGDETAQERLSATQASCLTEWGLPTDKREELEDFLEVHEDLQGDPATVTTVSDGDVLEIGDHRFEVVHLPGHAGGLVAYVFEREGRREAFVGDAILPKYTPNVGGADVRVDRPLANYLASLERIVDLDLDRAWPGHRGAIFAPSERARDIAGHHETRTERVLDVVREAGPVTAWEVSDALFGHLENIHILHGPGESYAHLDHLVHAGVLEATEEGYVLVDASRSAADVLAETRP